MKGYLATFCAIGATTSIFYSLNLIDKKQTIQSENEKVSQYYLLKNELREIVREEDLSHLAMVSSDIERILTDKKTVSQIEECETMEHYSFGLGLVGVICGVITVINVMDIKHSKRT